MSITKNSKQRPSSLVDTRVIYCGDDLEQLAKFPSRVRGPDLHRSPHFAKDSNRNCGGGEVFCGETKEKRSFEDRRESTRAYIDYMRPYFTQV